MPLRLLLILAITGLSPTPAMAVVPVNGTAPTLVPVTINWHAGDQTDPHVSGDWTAYTDITTIRYYNFVSTADAAIPLGGAIRDVLSDVSGSKIVFSRTFSTVKTAVMAFDAKTATAPIEIDPATTAIRLGAAIGGNTVAYVDLGLHANGELVIHDLVTATSTRVTNDAAFDQNPSVAPNGQVVTWEHCVTSLGNCDIWQAVRTGASWTVSVVNNSANPEANPDTNATVVVYDSQRAGDSDIFWRPVAGGAEAQLQLAGFERNPNTAGPFIAFEHQANVIADTDIFVYETGSNRLYQITATPLVNEQLNDITLLGDGRVRVVWASDEDGFDQRNIKGATFFLPFVSANAGPDQTVDEGTLVPLDGCGSVGVLYAWTQVAGVPTVTLANENSCNASFAAPAVPPGGAVLTFELFVSSGLGSGHIGGSDTVDVTVRNVNQAPSTDAGDDQRVKEGTAVTLDGSSSFDPDGDSLTYSWAQTAGTPVTLSDPVAVSPSFDAPFLGSGSDVLTFELTVSDGTASTTDEVAITVENVNHPPTAAAGADGSGVTGALVTLDGSLSSDPDGDVGLTYLWTQITGPAVTLTGEDQALATFIPGDAGTYVFRLTVTDPGELAGADEVTIVVLRPNDPPACDAARPNVPYLWPPNHKMHPVGISGVSDLDGDAVTITIVTVRQDEPVNGLGDGDTSPDAVIQGSTVLLRAERSGPWNGRYYHIGFHAEDSSGESCVGTMKVFVPHDMKKPISAVDEGPLYDSTQH